MAFVIGAPKDVWSVRVCVCVCWGGGGHSVTRLETRAGQRFSFCQVLHGSPGNAQLLKEEECFFRQAPFLIFPNWTHISYSLWLVCG